MDQVMGEPFRSGKAQEFGVQSAQDQSLIESLLILPEDQALRLLQAHVTVLGDAEYDASDATLAIV